MTSFHQHVNGEHKFVAGRRRDHRTVVTDAYAHGRIVGRAAKVAVDEREFVHAEVNRYVSESPMSSLRPDPTQSQVR